MNETFVISDEEFRKHSTAIMTLGEKREKDPARWAIILKMTYELMCREMDIEINSIEHHSYDAGDLQ